MESLRNFTSWICCVLGILLCTQFNILNAQDLEIINVRVGQGDATIIQGPIDTNGERINVLFDAGNISNRDGGNILRTVLFKRKIRRIDYVIVSHYDADHIGGIVSGGAHGTSLFLGFDGQEGGNDDIEIVNFIDRGDISPPTSQAYIKYKAIAESKNRKSLNNQSDLDQYNINLGGGAKMIALASNGFVKNRTNRVANVDTENERSLSFLVKYNDFDFLISGDLIGRSHGRENARVEAAVGEYIKSENIVVDVLHVNHHGGNNASETDFLASIKPTIAIISAGNGNRHSHPNRNVLKRLVENKVYRIIQTSWGTTRNTMEEDIREIQAIYQNDVIISTDGLDFIISTSRKYKVDNNPNR